MDKLNVCLANDSFPPLIDGVENAVTNYAEVINRSYGHAAVVTPYYPDADDSAFSYPVYRFPSIDTSKIVGYRAGVPFSNELMEKLERENFDLIHCHCPVTSMILCRGLRERIHVPVVFTYHTKFDVDIAKAVHGKLLQEEAIRLLVGNVSAADEVWTVSKGAGENLQSLGYQGDYIVMPNGVDIPSGRLSEDEIRELTAYAGIPDGIPVYLYVGRMMWYKGIRISLDALKAMKDAELDFRMVLIGKGTDLDEIKAYTTELALDDKVMFLGAIYDRKLLRAWYCRADLFLFPSTFDTNGLVVREAAACGLASVLIRGSCAAEDATNRRNGFLIEENAASMAALLSSLHDRTAFVRDVGHHAQNELYLSWSDAVANAVSRYHVVLENKHSGRYSKKEQMLEDLLKPLADACDSYYRVKEKIQAIDLSSYRNNFDN